MGSQVNYIYRFVLSARYECKLKWRPYINGSFCNVFYNNEHIYEGLYIIMTLPKSKLMIYFPDRICTAVRKAK